MKGAIAKAASIRKLSDRGCLLLKKGLAVAVLFGLVMGAWLLVAPVIQAATNPPRQPSRAYGTVTIGGSAAPVGTPVVAVISGIQVKSTTTDSSGFFAFNVPADNLDTIAKDGKPSRCTSATPAATQELPLISSLSLRLGALLPPGIWPFLPVQHCKLFPRASRPRS